MTDIPCSNFLQRLIFVVAFCTFCAPSLAADLDVSIAAGIQIAGEMVVQVEPSGLTNTNEARSLNADNWVMNTDTQGSEITLQIAQNAPAKFGVYSVVFHIQNEVVRYLLPVGMGVAVSPAAEEVVLYSPSQWMATFILAELRDGRVIAIWAKERGYPFKKLTMKGGRDFKVDIFRDVKLPLKSDWVVRTYPSWQQATDVFRAEVLRAHTQPSNAQTITQVINVQLGDDIAVLKHTIQKLAKMNDAKSTLLYLPLWRLDGYDENYPDYTPKPYLKEVIAFAHQLGFRVMLHFNTDFVSVSAAEKNKFWPERFLRWSATGCNDAVYYKVPNRPGHDSFVVNRGSKLWQNFLVESIFRLKKDIEFDAVHLDVSSNIPVGCSGDMIVGTTEIQKAIKNRMPDIILSGEYVNENSYAETDIYQALPIEISGWSESLTKRVSFHPIGLRMFAPARAYGHLHGGGVDRKGEIMGAKRQQLETRSSNGMQELIIPTTWVSRGQRNND